MDPTGFDERVMLCAKGVTTGDTVAHLQDMYGSLVSEDLVSRVIDTVMADMAELANRPLDPVDTVLLIDCIFVRIRDGQVAIRPIYVAHQRRRGTQRARNVGRPLTAGRAVTPA